MPAFKPDQRHLVVGGRSFHFVSYEGRPANAHRGEDEQPPMWYMMVAGRRFAMFPCDPAQDSAAIDKALSRWAEEHAMGTVALPEAATPTAKPVSSRHRRTWWGPN